LTAWQRVQLSRHPNRPYTLEHITNLTKDFLRTFGDRNFKDDKAMIGGLGQIDGQSFMIVGQQKESILRCVSIEIQDGKSRRL
jgi:acetyl-CoA carboxylase carboxyl transferase subunit alpha